MRTLRLIFLALLFGFNAFGQDVKIPINYQLKEVEDYAPYKDSVIIASNWIINTPLTEKNVTRELANQFLFKWISGAPYTHVELRSEFINDILNDEDYKYGMYLLMNYIAGMTLVKIENNEADDLIAQEAGIRAMLKGYESVRKEKKIKLFENAMKYEKKNKLSQWIIKNLKPTVDKVKIIPKD